jgi:hypothetical protein
MKSIATYKPLFVLSLLCLFGYGGERSDATKSTAPNPNSEWRRIGNNDYDQHVSLLRSR